MNCIQYFYILVMFNVTTNSEGITKQLIQTVTMLEQLREFQVYHISTFKLLNL